MRGRDKRRNSFFVLPVHFFCARVFQENFFFDFSSRSEPEKKPGCRKERGWKERRQERAKNKKQNSEVLGMSDKFIGAGGNNEGIACFSKFNDAGKEKPSAETDKENSGEAQDIGNQCKERNSMELWQRNNESVKKTCKGKKGFFAKTSFGKISVQNNGCNAPEKYPKGINNIREESEQIIGDERTENKADNENCDYNHHQIQLKTTTEKIVYYFFLNEYFMLLILMIFSLFSVYYLGKGQVIIALVFAFVSLAISYLLMEIGNWYGRKKRWFE